MGETRRHQCTRCSSGLRQARDATQIDCCKRLASIIVPSQRPGKPGRVPKEAAPFVADASRPRHPSALDHDGCMGWNATTAHRGCKESRYADSTEKAAFSLRPNRVQQRQVGRCGNSINPCVLSRDPPSARWQSHCSSWHWVARARENIDSRPPIRDRRPRPVQGLPVANNNPPSGRRRLSTPSHSRHPLPKQSPRLSRVAKRRRRASSMLTGSSPRCSLGTLMCLSLIHI